MHDWDACAELTLPVRCLPLQVGRLQVVLVEGPNKRAPTTEMMGKNDFGHRVMFPNFSSIPAPPHHPSVAMAPRPFPSISSSPRGPPAAVTPQQISTAAMPAGGVGFKGNQEDVRAGEFVLVHITSCTAASLRGVPVCRTNLRGTDCW